MRHQGFLAQFGNLCLYQRLSARGGDDSDLRDLPEKDIAQKYVDVIRRWAVSLVGMARSAGKVTKEK